MNDQIIMITPENQQQIRRDYPGLPGYRIGTAVQKRETEKLDLRLFGQLRSWLFGDKP